MTECDVVVLGAGPYGLAAGAHLGGIKGLDVRVFGEPMEFWKSYMPTGMFLRSPWSASHISDPEKALTMDGFQAQQKGGIPVPIPLARFVDYGLWFQKKALPALDRRRIQRIERDASGFRIILENGETWNSQRVVIAAGIASFARRPEVFAKLPSQLVTHCSDQNDVERFRGQRVAVIGAGQSALESAALIHEAGGKVEVLVREKSVHWLGWRAKMQKLGPLWKLLYAPTDVGPAGVSRIVAIPDSVKYFPRFMQNRFRTRSLRPAGARWLIDRMKAVKITTSRHVKYAEQKGEALQLQLNDGSIQEVDHVVLGTGYKVDVSRYPFLSPDLIRSLQTTEGFPHLTTGMESSIPGLHFLGAPAAWTYGPLMYFVAGTDFAGHNLARYIGHSTKNK